MKKELEIYVHVPFCVGKCKYCDFLSGPETSENIEKYVEALVSEIVVYTEYHTLSQNEEVTSIFLGGGTPSILTEIQIKRIMEALKKTFVIAKDAEITIEANPGTVTKTKLAAYKECGINRISFGLQSANNEELMLLGRIHTYEEFLESYYLARAEGFQNINVDLISAIPRQSVRSWEETLKKIIALKPEHISAYSLIIEEGTPFAKMYGEGTSGEKELPSEEEEREIYRRTEAWLNEAGYHRYEISNYAKPQKECRHNLGYWERKNYLGFGLGAASLMENVRYHNTEILAEYMENSNRPDLIRRDQEELSEIAQMEEFVFLGMRKIEGISLAEFQQNFKKDLKACYGENIERMKKQNLIEETGGRLKLTAQGIDVSNYVFAEILF